MKKMMFISLLVLALSSIFVLLAATDTDNYNLDVFPNPMETNSNVSAYFADKIPITVTLVSDDDLLVKTIYQGLSWKGQMIIPFDRIDDKGSVISKGKYWIVLTTNAKYTSTKKLLILK